MSELREQTYTPDEVAKILKISKHTVYELVKRGDLTAFRVGNKMRIDAHDLAIYKQNMRYISQSASKNRLTMKVDQGSPSSLSLAGSHDFLIEHLTHFRDTTPSSYLLHTTYIGSLDGLMMLYQGKTDIAAMHLLDPVTKEYNLPYVQRFFIQEPITVLKLAVRKQGLIVAQNNPKNIYFWEDLARKDVTFVNRQKGSGTRFLLDSELAKRRIRPQHIRGYEQEVWNHLDAAACVARGSADVTLGIEAAAKKLNLSFIPLKTESFDLIFRWTKDNSKGLTSFCELLQSDRFKNSLQHLDGYDFSQLGHIIYQANV